MVLFNQSLTIFEDEFLSLGNTIWGKTTFTLAERHRTPSSMEAKTYLAGRSDLAVKRTIIRKDV
jgi:hypothetical protein